MMNRRMTLRSGLVFGAAMSGLPATGCASADSVGKAESGAVPGYRLGDPALPPSRISAEAFEELKASLLFTAEDEKYLRMSLDVLEPNVEELVGVWYGFVGSSPHLLKYFSDDGGTPDGDYLASVRARFERWVLDTARAEYGPEWLAYQFEIGRRHHRVGKNSTDGARAVDHIHFRHIPALTIPITTTIRPFLARGGHSEVDVDKMHAAWVKSVLMQSILWSYPYVKAGDF